MGQGVAIRVPGRRTDHEAELGVVIGRKTGPIAEADRGAAVINPPTVR
jgi:2-keto-4-pentenoate hydratase/2-oxohepta-3-ene-1,7-dioic acid hydratase in catechol pathway